MLLKGKRRHHCEEIYESLYNDVITRHIASVLGTGPRTRAETQTQRRASRKLCWENASEEIKTQVKGIIENEPDWAAEREKRVDDRKVEERSAAEIAEYVH